MEQPPPLAEPPTDAPQPSTTSLASRLLNVLAAPGEILGGLRHTPVAAANWLAPALILIVVSWLGAWLVFSQEPIQHQLTEMTEQAIDKQIEKQHMPPQQAEQTRQVAAKYGSIGAKASAAAAPVFYAFATPFWWGLILWLVGTKVLKAGFPYMKAVEIAGLANMVAVLDAVIKTLLIVTFGNLFASPSLALLVTDFNPQNHVHSLLSIVNIMTFWLLGVRAMGLARLSGASFAKAAVWVFGIWALFTGLFFGFGVAMQAVFAR